MEIKCEYEKIIIPEGKSQVDMLEEGEILYNKDTKEWFTKKDGKLEPLPVKLDESILK